MTAYPCPYCGDTIAASTRGMRPRSRAVCDLPKCRREHRAWLERERLRREKESEERRSQPVDPVVAVAMRATVARRKRLAEAGYVAVKRDEVDRNLGARIVRPAIPGDRIRPSHLSSFAAIEGAWSDGFVPDGTEGHETKEPQHRRRRNAADRRQDALVEEWLATLPPEEAASKRAALAADD